MKLEDINFNTAVPLRPSEYLANWGKMLKKNPKAWTQKVFARDGKGNPTDWFDPKAKCWCIEGLIAKDTAQLDARLVGLLRQALSLGMQPRLYRFALITYNDRLSSPEEMLAWLRRAWKEAKALEHNNPLIEEFYEK